MCVPIYSNVTFAYCTVVWFYLFLALLKVRINLDLIFVLLASLYFTVVTT